MDGSWSQCALKMASALSMNLRSKEDAKRTLSPLPMNRSSSWTREVVWTRRSPSPQPSPRRRGSTVGRFWTGSMGSRQEAFLTRDEKIRETHFPMKAQSVRPVERPSASRQPGSDVEEMVRRHLGFGWWTVLIFLTLGLVLETLHGLKIQ